MKVLVTGNMGYFGSMLTKFIARKYPNIEIVGFDTSFFGGCLTGMGNLPEASINIQYFGDVRNIDASLLADVDTVIHLAAISNDPMGAEFEEVTYEINADASIALANKAAAAGVANFVFASSCSIYGTDKGSKRSETDPTNPLTAYARSKVRVENALRSSDLGDMVTTCLRFATACGWSDRLRLDLVLNDFVASALSLKKIEILSDGTPWRPLIDLEDMSRAVGWAMSRSKENGSSFVAVNTGRDEFNYKVLDLASEVAKSLPGTEIYISKSAQPDKRSYAVDFSLFRQLAPDYQPIVTLSNSISRLIEGISVMQFSGSSIRDSQYIRLNTLRSHIKNDRLDNNLRWKSKNN